MKVGTIIISNISSVFCPKTYSFFTFKYIHILFPWRTLRGSKNTGWIWPGKICWETDRWERVYIFRQAGTGLPGREIQFRVSWKWLGDLIGLYYKFSWDHSPTKRTYYNWWLRIWCHQRQRHPHWNGENEETEIAGSPVSIVNRANLNYHNFQPLSLAIDCRPFGPEL